MESSYGSGLRWQASRHKGRSRASITITNADAAATLTPTNGAVRVIHTNINASPASVPTVSYSSTSGSA